MLSAATVLPDGALDGLADSWVEAAVVTGCTVLWTEVTSGELEAAAVDAGLSELGAAVVGSPLVTAWPVVDPVKAATVDSAAGAAVVDCSGAAVETAGWLEDAGTAVEPDVASVTGPTDVSATLVGTPAVLAAVGASEVPGAGVVPSEDTTAGCVGLLDSAVLTPRVLDSAAGVDVVAGLSAAAVDGP